jgi:hypothetical protein
MDCDVSQPSADDSNSSSPSLAIEDEPIVDALAVLSRAPVSKSKDEAARKLFSLLIPKDAFMLDASRYV